MKSYFYSGNTPVINGVNTQSCGIIEASNEAPAIEVFNEIIAQRMKHFSCDTFAITSFNEVGNNGDKES
jgi:hypothetical protein